MVASRVGGKRPHAAKSSVATTTSWDLEKDDVQVDPEVVDADLADYFGSSPHAELLKSVARRIVDRRVLHLIGLPR
jgi:retron-type reverse transcriptase